MAATWVLDRLRQPEHTGENRCMPCTVVNLGIAIAVSALVALVSPPVAAVALVLFVGTIALRGYLVPGTPTLTERYFPRSLLRLFGKRPAVTSATLEEEDVGEGTERLVAAGILGECDERDDLCLSDAFRDAWREQIRTVRTDDERTSALAAALDIPSGELDVTERGGAYFATIDGRQVGQWNSEAALVADIAGARALDGRLDGWADIDLERRGTTLAALRLFLERCPTCDGAVEMEETTADPAAGEACCFEKTVVRVRCERCDAVLFQTNAF